MLPMVLPESPVAVGLQIVDFAVWKASRSLSDWVVNLASLAPFFSMLDGAIFPAWEGLMRPTSMPMLPLRIAEFLVFYCGILLKAEYNVFGGALCLELVWRL
ncbi:hypothetical protein Nepgr_006776 [Nepenthes gracilis]|uniref:Uncharacterized protein n=1 Tax=Nepenthes gracilis TaxID=150966 RepID=A0AAD3XHX3_NEPGR|nr:hypothetical protein Nepgr_006776 [Nepenthes gracilis]